ncbi:hypothetical protein [Streptomyces avermitilis]|uniref:hypothetical protein n=1 Tax=Streptomyces avermitilis TaxID=33903 RepID=UPI0033BE638E
MTAGAPSRRSRGAAAMGLGVGGSTKVKPVGDWLGDGLEPWQEPSPHQVNPVGDAPGKPSGTATGSRRTAP